MKPAFITGLPRSRTYWFVQYLRACGVPAHHELMNGIPCRESFYSRMREGCVDSDCGLIMSDFQREFPGICADCAPGTYTAGLIRGYPRAAA